MSAAVEARPRSRGRSVRAIAAGFLAVALLSTLADGVMHGAGVFPPWGQVMTDGMFVVATLYRVVFTVLGGYLTARLAPDRAQRHVLILGAAGTAVALLGVLAWSQGGPELGPAWFPLTLVVTALPSVWLGGWLRWSREAAASAAVR